LHGYRQGEEILSSVSDVGYFITRLDVSVITSPRYYTDERVRDNLPAVMFIGYSEVSA
jgi:hypothetical protein